MKKILKLAAENNSLFFGNKKEQTNFVDRKNIEKWKLWIFLHTSIMTFEVNITKCLFYFIHYKFQLTIWMVKNFLSFFALLFGCEMKMRTRRFFSFATILSIFSHLHSRSKHFLLLNRLHIIMFNFHFHRWKHSGKKSKIFTIYFKIR